MKKKKVKAVGWAWVPFMNNKIFFPCGRRLHVGCHYKKYDYAYMSTTKGGSIRQNNWDDVRKVRIEEIK